MPSRTSAPLLAALLAAGLIAVPALAGVRVVAPESSPRSHFDVPHRSNLQFGGGPSLLTSDRAPGNSPVGWNGAAALEGVVTSDWSLILRGEHTRFERSQSIGLSGVPEVFIPGPVSQRTIETFEALELGARYSAPAGSFHPYFEAAGGFGRRVERLEERGGGNPAFDRNEVTRSLLTTVDLAVGTAWQPVGGRLGLFLEVRGSGDAERSRSLWVSPRAGLELLQK